MRSGIGRDASLLSRQQTRPVEDHVNRQPGIGPSGELPKEKPLAVAGDLVAAANRPGGCLEEHDWLPVPKAATGIDRDGRLEQDDVSGF